MTSNTKRLTLFLLICLEIVLVIAAIGTYPSHSIFLEKKWMAYQQKSNTVTEEAWKQERNRLRHVDATVFGAELLLLIANGVMIAVVVKRNASTA